MQFERFTLDHEKCRSRLWGGLKKGRPDHHPGYTQTLSILSVKDQLKHHNQLDLKLYDIVKYYLKSNQPLRALTSVKSLIRTIGAGKNLIDLFDDFKMRNLAVDLEKYYEGKQKEQEHQLMQ